MSKIIKKIKQKFCRHQFKSIGFTMCAGGFLPLRGYCFDVMECRKCGLKQIGDHRKLTHDEECYMASCFLDRIQKEKMEDKL